MIERFLIQALMKEFPISTTIKWCLVQALRKEFPIPTTIKNFLTLFKRTNNFPTLIEEGKLPSSHPSPLELHSGSQESCPSCEIGNQPSQTPQIHDSGWRLATSSFWPFCQDELRIFSSGQSNFSEGVYLVVEVEIKHGKFPHILSWGHARKLCNKKDSSFFSFP